jgi:flagellum-specific ATP synthase
MAPAVKHQNSTQRIGDLRAAITSLPPYVVEGRIVAASGLSVELAGLSKHLAIGDRITLGMRDGGVVPAEIVAFHEGRARAMTFASCDGLGPGGTARVPWQANNAGNRLAVAESWIGRVVDPLGRPLDNRGALGAGDHPLPVRGTPPPATSRARLGPRIDLGVRALNSFVTCRQGQRIGLFAGSGVGKSTLLAMLTRHSDCDVAVLALVGERGREVREFLEDELGPTGLARSVVVVATSDTPPLMRRDAAYTAMTIAEYFRDRGKNVLLLMDSVTRFCLALREIGLSTGEPPATRGYPPSVFAELPRLLERAGPGQDRQGGSGFITAMFTVLVEGDDHNEPVADAVRGILDGHVILDRRIGERGRYPAIDVLRSLSRTVPGCNNADENALTRRARAILALYAEVADLVRLGAYRTGTDPAVDEAVRLAPRIEAFLTQGREEVSSLGNSFSQLAEALEK